MKINKLNVVILVERKHAKIEEMLIIVTNKTKN